jgi:hypothetical protein
MLCAPLLHAVVGGSEKKDIFWVGGVVHFNKQANKPIGAQEKQIYTNLLGTLTNPIALKARAVIVSIFNFAQYNVSKAVVNISAC